MKRFAITEEMKNQVKAAQFEVAGTNEYMKYLCELSFVNRKGDWKFAGWNIPDDAEYAYKAFGKWFARNDRGGFKYALNNSVVQLWNLEQV